MTLTLVFLKLDAEHKAVMYNLYLVSSQLPSFQLGSESLTTDAAAVFRVAKEFALSELADETRAVDIEDVLRLARFICWMLTHYDQAPNKTSESAVVNLRSLFASIVLQTQAQNSGFEGLLRSFGIDRQIENQFARARSVSDHKNQPGSKTELKLEKTRRVQESRINVGPLGSEIVNTIYEEIIRASGRRP